MLRHRPPGTDPPRPPGKKLPTQARFAGRPGTLTAVLVPLSAARSDALTARFSPDVPGPASRRSTGACEPTAYKLRVTPSGGGSFIVPVSPATPVCEHGGLHISVFTRLATCGSTSRARSSPRPSAPGSTARRAASRRGLRLLRAPRELRPDRELTPDEVYRVDGEGSERRTPCSPGSTARWSTTAPRPRSASSPSSCERRSALPRDRRARHGPAARAASRQRARRRDEPVRDRRNRVGRPRLLVGRRGNRGAARVRRALKTLPLSFPISSPTPGISYDSMTTLVSITGESACGAGRGRRRFCSRARCARGSRARRRRRSPGPVTRGGLDHRNASAARSTRTATRRRWYSEYGNTTTLRHETSSASAAREPRTSPSRRTLTGLSPGTTYHYRIVATSTGGTTIGADGIFTTAGRAADRDRRCRDRVGPRRGDAERHRSMPTAGDRPTTSSTARPTRYGTKTVRPERRQDTNPVTVSAADPRACRAASTYHFRLVASTTAGRRNGNDVASRPAAARP